VDLIHQIYFYGIWQMGMKDRSLIDKINPTFIALTATAIHHYQSAWKTDVFRVPPVFSPRGGAQHKSRGDGIEFGDHMGWFCVERSKAACSEVLVYVSIRLSESQ
jgi:hypothetical protein